MGQIALHDYLSQIEWLIEENRLAQAAAHCRQILSQYPSHVDTYRLLGRTLLEQQQFRDAEDIYLRILSADPEDLVAHAGLTLIYRGFGDGVRAKWHLQCAYDMDPYNRAIQEELVELMASQEELDLDSMSLSHGALGRIYFRGSHYRQAAAELQLALTDSPDRLDLQVLLAEALYRDERRVDAINVCLDILEHLPSCVKANAILAVVWAAGGLTEEAQEPLRKLWSLTLADKKHCDDTTLIGQALCHSSALTLPDQIYVKELDYAPTATELKTDDIIRDHDVEVRMPDKSVIPDWLKEPADSSLTGQSAAKALNNEDQEMLDWLEGVAVAEGDLFDNVDDLDEHSKHPSTENNSHEFRSESEENLSPIVEKVDIEFELDNVFEELGIQNEGSQFTDESTGFKGMEQDREHGSIKHLGEISDESDTETDSMPDDETYGPLTELLNDLAKSPSDVEENDLNWLFDEARFDGEIELEDTDELPGWMVDDVTADQRDVSKHSASGVDNKADFADSQTEYDKIKQTDSYDSWKQSSATDLKDMQQDEAPDWDLDDPGGEDIDEQVKGWDQSSEKLPDAEQGQSSNPAWLTILAAENLISDVEGNDQKHSIVNQEHVEDQPLAVRDESDQLQDIDVLSDIDLEVDPEVTAKSVDDAYDTNELGDITLDSEIDADQKSSDTDELDDNSKLSGEENQSPASWLEALSNEDHGSKEYVEPLPSIVDDIKDSDEIEGGEPDWLYDAIGFTSSLDLPEPGELPNWYQEATKEQNTQDNDSLPVEEDEDENDKPADKPENLEAELSELELPKADIQRQYSEQTAQGAAKWLAALAGENSDEGIRTAGKHDKSSDLNWLGSDSDIEDSQAQSEESNELEEIDRKQQLFKIDEERHSDHESEVKDRVSHWLEDLTEDSAPKEPIQGSSNVKNDSDLNMLSALRDDTDESASAPDWLFDAIGFTGAPNLSDTGELPGWLDESGIESEAPLNDYSRPKPAIDATEGAISLDQADSPEKPIENEKNDSLVYDEQYLDDFMEGATTWLDALATEGESESKSGTSLEEWLARDKDESAEGGFPEWLGALMNNEYAEDEITDTKNPTSNDEQDDDG